MIILMDMNTNINININIYTNTNINSLNVKSGQMFDINDIGNVIVKAFASKSEYKDSNIVSKVYKILDKCEEPIFSKNSGTYSGTLQVTLSSRTHGAKIYYTISTESPGIQPTLQSTFVENNGILIISQTGIVILRAFAAYNGLANSDIRETVYTIIPKVLSPIISPSSATFTTSATLSFHCPTPNSTIYYTIDGGNPTDLSLKVEEVILTLVLMLILILILILPILLGW